MVIGGTLNCTTATDESIIDKRCLKCAGIQWCRKHKAQFIEWKCMLCCERTTASYICGTSHFCNSCHHNPVPKVCNSLNCLFDGKHPKHFSTGTRHKKQSLGCAACK